MPPSVVSSPIVWTAAPLAAVDADLIVVPWFEDESPSAVAGLDRAVGDEITRALASKEFAARPYDQFTAAVVDGTWKPRRVLLVGAFTLASALMSAMGVLAGGVQSPYFGGVMVVLVMYAVASGEHWKRAASSATAGYRMGWTLIPRFIRASESRSAATAVKASHPSETTRVFRNVCSRIIAATPWQSVVPQDRRNRFGEGSPL